MSIIINKDTKLIVQGITGREGQFHTKTMIEYGTNVVGGVTPGKGGQEIFGLPVFNTVKEAVEATGANATIIFVPAKFTPASVMEALDAGLKTVLTISEHTPVHEMMKCYWVARQKGAKLYGPNSFGIISPGKSKAGFMANRIFKEGNIGVMTRSATNGYESVYMMSCANMGQSTVVGIGGDMIPGSKFIDVLPDFEADHETKAIVMIGEIGGGEEELAAAYIKAHVTKPVVALIAGKNAPKGKNMGHAGAIVSADGTGSAESKEAALADAGVYLAESTIDIVNKLKQVEKDFGIKLTQD